MKCMMMLWHGMHIHGSISMGLIQNFGQEGEGGGGALGNC